MHLPAGKQCSTDRRDGSASGEAPVFSVLSHAAGLIAITLICVFGQGCAAVGIALLGAAAGTATKAGVTYHIENKAQRTFTAPMGQVKTSLLAALSELAFPIETEERIEGGERIIARLEGREMEIRLESITPKATKMAVVVREGWFFKDRATADEIIEQTSRDVDATILTARGGGRGVLHTTFPKPGPAKSEELRPTPAVLDARDAQRWREGFKPQDSVDPQNVGPVGPPVALSMISLGNGDPSKPEEVRPPPACPVPVALPSVATPPDGTGAGTGGEDNRWRVLRDLRLLQCPDAACPPGAPLKKGVTVARLSDTGQWWRVQITGTDSIGWILAKDVAPRSWWDPPRGPARLTSR